MEILAIDPGRDKCGLAVIKDDNSLVLHEIVESSRLVSCVQSLAEKHELAAVVLGNGTTSGEFEVKLRALLPEVRLEVVDEYQTTELARREYWKLYPPQGWRRFLPLSLQVPPRPVDDIAALIMARRYLRALNKA